MLTRELQKRLRKISEKRRARAASENVSFSTFLVHVGLAGSPISEEWNFVLEVGD